MPNTAEEIVVEPVAAKKSKPKIVDVIHQGEKIILPEGMSAKEGITWLQRKDQEDNQMVVIIEEVHTFPLDGALAFAKALSRIYGFTALVPSRGWFSTPPFMVSVNTGVGTTEQVPWGNVQVPDIDGVLCTQIGLFEKRPILTIRAEVRQRERFKVKRIAELAREIVRNESIYKGKALKMSFPDLEHEEWQVEDAPQFLDLSKVKADELIFEEDVADQINISLFTPIEKTEMCLLHKVPLKRGVLLEGPYGVGKTQTAYVTARKAQDNNWTFIYLDDIDDLAQAMLFAQAYQPAVIFAEDIDQVVGDQERDSDTNGILNTIDGVIAKDSQVIVVLTTNHVETINKAMLRPGRLDAVISIRPPDTKAVERLIRLYARGLILEGEDLSSASKLMAGQQPASVREVVERSKLAAISRAGDATFLTLTGKDLESASKGMVAHLELLRTVEVDTRPSLEKAASTIAEAIKNDPLQNGSGKKKKDQSSAEAEV